MMLSIHSMNTFNQQINTFLLLVCSYNHHRKKKKTQTIQRAFGKTTLHYRCVRICNHRSVLEFLISCDEIKGNHQNLPRENFALSFFIFTLFARVLFFCENVYWMLHVLSWHQNIARLKKVIETFQPMLLQFLSRHFSAKSKFSSRCTINNSILKRKIDEKFKFSSFFLLFFTAEKMNINLNWMTFWNIWQQKRQKNHFNSFPWRS